MSQPRVSVLMPVHNAEETLAEALRSICGQTLHDIEIVAVDDGSEDASGRILREAASRDPRVRPVAREHGGLVAALNAGLRHCRAPFVARMDADDVSLPERLEKQLEMLEDDPGLGVAGCLVEGFPPAQVGEGMRLYLEWQNRLRTHEEIVREIFVESPITHPSACVRRSVLEEARGYEDRGWAEDYDLWLRLAASGVRFAKVPEVLLRWREHPGRLTRTDGRYSVENFLRAKAHYLLAGPLRGARRRLHLGRGKDRQAPFQAPGQGWMPPGRLHRHRPGQDRPHPARGRHHFCRGVRRALAPLPQPDAAGRGCLAGCPGRDSPRAAARCPRRGPRLPARRLTEPVRFPPPEIPMPRFHYCLNSSTIQPVPLLDKIRLASGAGFGAIELWSDDIDAFIQAGGSLAEVRGALEDGGLEVPGVIAVHGWLGSRGEEHAAALAEAGRRMEQAAAVGAPRIVASPPLEPCDLGAAGEQYRELIELGEQFRIWPAMEFLGFAGSVHTITQAWEIARAADHPEARVVMDPFHILRGGGSAAEIASVPGGRVAIWHWNDVPPKPPLPQQGDADRVMPGDGAGPLREIERQAVARGYSGYVSLELFNREWWARDPEETVRVGMEKMRGFFSGGS